MIPELSMDYKKRYIAFKKDKKNIFDLLIQKSQLKLWLNVKNGELEDPKKLQKMFQIQVIGVMEIMK